MERDKSCELIERSIMKLASMSQVNVDSPKFETESQSATSSSFSSNATDRQKNTKHSRHSQQDLNENLIPTRSPSPLQVKKTITHIKPEKIQQHNKNKYDNENYQELSKPKRTVYHKNKHDHSFKLDKRVNYDCDMPTSRKRGKSLEAYLCPRDDDHITKGNY
jgi:hypothetical protein